MHSSLPFYFLCDPDSVNQRLSARRARHEGRASRGVETLGGAAHPTKLHCSFYFLCEVASGEIVQPGAPAAVEGTCPDRCANDVSRTLPREVGRTFYFLWQVAWGRVERNYCPHCTTRLIKIGGWWWCTRCGRPITRAADPVINKSSLSANCRSAHRGMRGGRRARVPGLFDLVQTESAQAQGLYPLRGVLDAAVAQVRGAGRGPGRPTLSTVSRTQEARACSVN